MPAGRPSKNNIAKETTSENLNLEKIITDAVTKAVNETSAKYEQQITQLKQQTSNSEDNFQMPNANKRIKIMHMALGSASFINNTQGMYVNFAKTFDTYTAKFEIIEKMYNLYTEWFETFEIVILDKQVREYLGLENKFQEMGADKDKFNKMIYMETNKILDEISHFKSHMVAMAFLKYFIDEHLSGNIECSKKVNSIDTYYKTKYGLPPIYEIIAEIKDE